MAFPGYQSPWTGNGGVPPYRLHAQENYVIIHSLKNKKINKKEKNKRRKITAQIHLLEINNIFKIGSMI